MNILGHRHRWKAIRTIWPYPDGYGTYCSGCRTLLDSGQTKDAARRGAQEENKRGKP